MYGFFSFFLSIIWNEGLKLFGMILLLSHVVYLFLPHFLGQLDRLVQGMVAEELMNACDENSVLVDVSDSGLANPAVHFFRGLRHRNLAAIRHAAQVNSI